jgi:hypothetical protein
MKKPIAPATIEPESKKLVNDTAHVEPFELFCIH